jgi:hypothetical protein
MRSDWKPGLVLACICSLGCVDFHRGPGPVARDAAAEADAQGDAQGDDAQGDVDLIEDLTFETEVYPILQIRCGDCHKSRGMGGYTQFVLTGNARIDRAMVMALVTPGEPENSLLLQRATGNAHSGGRVLVEDSDPYNIIASWILLLPLP